MPSSFTQPKVDRHIEWLRGRYHFGMKYMLYDPESLRLLNELFDLLEQIEPDRNSGLRSLWLRAERGPIEDYGDVNELIEDGEFESEEAFVREWKDFFPNEIEWYLFTANKDDSHGFRAIILRHDVVIVQDEHRETVECPIETSEFIQWMIDGVQECLDMLRAGTYNDFVQENLPPQHRTGTILRKDFWDVWPEARKDFFKDISPDDVSEFIRLAREQPDDDRTLIGRLQNMTANDFYRYCAIGYAANGYSGGDLSPKEQYYLHADGRDEDLKDVAPDSPEAFRTWFHDRNRFGGHPWEVCMGGNSTHISLYVSEDDSGYYLYLAGSAESRTIETVKFFLALHREGIPVYLADAHLLADRLAETERIGIVPEGITPTYCSRYFPNERIIDFMNLPYEDREKFLPFCTWLEEAKVYLTPQEKGV